MWQVVILFLNYLNFINLKNFRQKSEINKIEINKNLLYDSKFYFLFLKFTNIIYYTRV